MMYNLIFSQYNERSILIEWPAKIDEIILNDILNFKKSIESKYTKQKVDIIHAYTSILIIYDFTIDIFNDKILELKSLYGQKNKAETTNSSIWGIPVCYDNEFGFDLDEFSRLKKLSKEEIIQLHSEVIYTVYFIGFLPGFLYLGRLNPKLFLDRKSTPNLNIEKGSVAIGGEQTGVYPENSPGGWHIIGKTPIELFNSNENSPCKIKAGDKVKFKPITKLEFFDIDKRIANSTFQLKTYSL